MKNVDVRERLPVCLKPMITGNMINLMQRKLNWYGFDIWHRFFFYPIEMAVYDS